jgi:hypothetical protein
MPSVGLLLPTLAEIPNLPGAACVEHREVFDACPPRQHRRSLGEARGYHGEQVAR